MMGMIIVRMKMGKTLPLCSSKGLYFGVITKYVIVPAKAVKIG
jgi:hypothetical protein